MVVDVNEDKLSDLLPLVDRARIGDCTKREVLGAFGVESFDVCMVCIKEDFQNSLQVTDLLKDLGAKFVIAKAGSELHAKFLLRNGADQVVYPEKEMAAHLAVRTTTQNVLDFVNLTENIGIFEVPVPVAWAGKGIGEMAIRIRHNLTVLVVKNKDKIVIPGPEYVFLGSERIMVLGSREDVAKLQGLS
jgi:trk system potassium uptake protein TrkA